ncbi:MAG TPA: MFS transporter [Kofleriaceae bacterium]|nr:MFS transporter [Kofleriaceae bacterium]
MLLAQGMLILDASVVNVALPAMRADLDVDPVQLTWITNSYLIAFGGLLLLFGRLGDLIGRRRVFLFGLGLFTAASIACGLADSAAILIVSRFVQGIGAAAASSVILALIAVEFPDANERAKAMSGYMFVSVAGGSFGLFAGGLLTQLLSWHWIFLVNVPIGLIAIELARRSLRETAARPVSRRIDVAGAVLVTAAAMAAIYGLVTAAREPWSSTAVRVPLSAALALTVIFFVVEATVEQPLLPLRVLRIRSLMITSVIRGFMAMGMYAIFFLGSLDMSTTLGFGPLRTGLAFLPQTLVVAILALGLTARASRRYGPRRVLVVGLAMVAVGIGVMASLGLHEPYMPIRAAAHVVLGVGLGMSFLPLLTLAMSDVQARDAGLGSAIVSLSMQLSGAVDLAILVTAASFRAHALAGDGTPVADATILGYRFAYVVALVGILVGLTLATTLLRERSRP